MHREDGPAYIYTVYQEQRSESISNTIKYWFKNDQLHREDGPAIEMKYGHNEWYIYGKRHRENGPAVEWHSKKPKLQYKSYEEKFIESWQIREDEDQWWKNGARIDPTIEMLTI